MQRGALLAIGVLGLAAVALYVGATLLGGVLDSGYSHIGNAISELTGSEAPNRAVLAPTYIAYNLLLVGFGYALMRASSDVALFKVARCCSRSGRCPVSGR